MMIADIKLIEPDQHAVFGLAAAPVTDENEQEWFAGVLKACEGGVGNRCQIGSQARLIEMACLDRGKADALGDSNMPQGFWLGVLIDDPDVWKSIESGMITHFTVDVSPSGMSVEFQGVQKIHKAKGENEMFSEITSSSTRTSCANQPASVTKVLNTRDPTILTKSDCDSALDDLAKAAQRDDESFHASYHRVMHSRLGQQIYHMRDQAKAAEPVIEKQDGPAVSQAWKKITDSAMALRAKDPKLEHHAAIDQVLKENPQLYDAYNAETAAKPAADSAHQA